MAIILFVDEKYDPGNRMLACIPPCRFIRCNLADCLDHIGEKAGALSVLKPLTFSEEEKLPEAVQEWKTDIHSLELSEQKIKSLMDLLIYAILTRTSRNHEGMETIYIKPIKPRNFHGIFTEKQ